MTDEPDLSALRRKRLSALIRIADSADWIEHVLPEVANQMAALRLKLEAENATKKECHRARGGLKAWKYLLAFMDGNANREHRAEDMGEDRAGDGKGWEG